MHKLTVIAGEGESVTSLAGLSPDQRYKRAGELLISYVTDYLTQGLLLPDMPRIISEDTEAAICEWAIDEGNADAIQEFVDSPNPRPTIEDAANLEWRLSRLVSEINRREVE